VPSAKVNRNCEYRSRLRHDVNDRLYSQCEYILSTNAVPNSIYSVSNAMKNKRRVTASMQLVVFAVPLISFRRIKGQNGRTDRDCFLLNFFSFDIHDHLHTSFQTTLSLQLIEQLNNSTSSVGIATRLWAGGPRNRGPIPGGRFFSCPQRPDRLWGPPSILGGKAAAASTEVKNSRVITPRPIRLHGVVLN
jgi:hypothetical protein